MVTTSKPVEEGGVSVRAGGAGRVVVVVVVVLVDRSLAEALVGLEGDANVADNSADLSLGALADADSDRASFITNNMIYH